MEKNIKGTYIHGKEYIYIYIYTLYIYIYIHNIYTYIYKAESLCWIAEISTPL